MYYDHSACMYYDYSTCIMAYRAHVKRSSDGRVHGAKSQFFDTPKVLINGPQTSNAVTISTIPKVSIGSNICVGDVGRNYGLTISP